MNVNGAIKELTAAPPRVAIRKRTLEEERMAIASYFADELAKLRREERSIGRWTGVCFVVYALPWLGSLVAAFYVSEYFGDSLSGWLTFVPLALAFVFGGLHSAAADKPSGLYLAIRCWSESIRSRRSKILEEREEAFRETHTAAKP